MPGSFANMQGSVVDIGHFVRIYKALLWMCKTPDPMVAKFDVSI